MNLKLHYNVTSTYSQKVILAFYEKGVEFTAAPVNLRNPEQHAAYRMLYPLAKVPLLTGDDIFIPESSIIIEFLEDEFPNSGTRLIPKDKTAARHVRFKERVTDLYLNNPICTLFVDCLKPADQQNPEAVAKARETIDITYGFMEQSLSKNPTAGATDFNMADCAAFAPLFYAQRLHPFADHENINAYFRRLMQRPSVQRMLIELLPALVNFSSH